MKKPTPSISHPYSETIKGLTEAQVQEKYAEYRTRVKPNPPYPGENFLPSLIPVESYPFDTEEEQLEALKESPQLKQFAEYRARAKDLLHNPSYHFYSPDGKLNDPNGLCFWKGKCHLFYQVFPNEDARPHWGHMYSEDMVHWKDLPFALYPDDKEYAPYSGSSLVEEDRVIATYHGRWSGNKIVTASDPLLLNWEKSKANPVIPILPDHATNNGRPYTIFDPFLWKEGSDYFALSGVLYGNHEERGKNHRNEMVEHLFHSQDLEHWVYMGELAPGGFPQMPLGNDGACPYFWPLGDKHVLFIFSHETGPYAFIGDYDKITHRFTPDRLHKFNFGQVGCSSYQAPCATPDGNGGVYLVFNTKEADITMERNGAMSVMYHVTLGDDQQLRIKPVDQLASLHGGLYETNTLHLNAFETQTLPVNGRALDIQMAIKRGSARAVRIEVLKSADGREHTDVVLHMPIARRPQIGYLTVDTAFSSLSLNTMSRLPENTQFPLEEDELLNVRILVDKCMVEVFVNDRVVLMQMMCPTLSDSDHISITAMGGDATVESAQIWQMNSIYE